MTDELIGSDITITYTPETEEGMLFSDLVDLSTEPEPGEILIYDNDDGSLTWPAALEFNGELIAGEYAVTVEEIYNHIRGKQEGIMLYSWEGILLVIVICLVTIKWIHPWVTLRRLVRAIRDLAWKPFSKKCDEIEKEWKGE